MLDKMGRGLAKGTARQYTRTVKVDDFEWRWQKFKVRIRSQQNRTDISPDLGSPSDINDIKGALMRDPKPGEFRKALPVSVGSVSASQIDTFGIDNFLKDVLPDLGFEIVREATEDFVLE